MSKQEGGCPICEGSYYAINRSFDCCRKHKKWLVSRCETCDRYSFTDLPGLCPNCQRVGAKRLIGLGFNKNHRWMLQVYGFEHNNGWN